MFLATDSDGTGGYLSPDRPRLCDPELRSRVVGYLATAPALGPAHRTDGTWIWPMGLARLVATRGAGPEQAMLDHIIASGLMPPEYLPQETVENARHVLTCGSASTAPRVADDVVYYAAYAGTDRATASRNSPVHLLRRHRRSDGTATDEVFGPYGWSAFRDGGVSLFAITEAEAAEVLDARCAEFHARLMSAARETLEQDGVRVRVARVFDTDGAWFSPDRLRIVEDERRHRLVAYLSGGRLVIRVTGRMADPLAPDGDMVPLNYRTDGVWVWQEALAHYVRTRGVAPELAFLCHIEERGYRLPEHVDDAVVRECDAVIRCGRFSVMSREPMRYYLDGDLLVRASAADPSRMEFLTDHLRWRALSSLDRARSGTWREISEQDASAVVDARWSALRAGRAG